MMQDSFHEQNEDDYSPDVKSKTKVKQEMLALTDLGRDIAQLKPEQLAQIPLTDELLRAINDSHKITQNSARKRHFQFIGKLMRKADSEAIVEAYEKLVNDIKNDARQLHTIEKWRDQLLTGENAAFESFVDLYPSADRQQIRTLIRCAQKETSQNKPPANARKLFKLIRETINA